jgi:hypothetical protein
VDIRNVKLDRREMLKLSSAAAVTPALIGATAAGPGTVRSALAATRTIASASPRVSVGYWDGMLDSTFIDARHVASGSTAPSAWVRLSAGYDESDAASWEGFGSISLSFDLRPLHDGELRAWHYQSSPVPNVSAVADIVLPADAGSGINGWIDFRDADPAATPTRVAINLPLRQGHCVIAVAPARSRWSVDWDALLLRPTNGGDALLLGNRDGASFDHPNIIVEVVPG